MQRAATIKDFYRILRKNLPILLMYLFIWLAFPIFAIFSANELLPIFSLIYQILGIALLYLDERFKMKRNSWRFPKSNSFYHNILKSPEMVLYALKQIFRYWFNPPKKDCNLDVAISRTDIDHDYKEIDDEDKKNRARIISMESDLSSLRYFSEVRKAGYLLLATGFLLQFFAIVMIQNY